LLIKQNVKIKIHYHIILSQGVFLLKQNEIPIEMVLEISKKREK